MTEYDYKMRRLTDDLGDAAPFLQDLVDRGLAIPPGYYKLSRQVVTPDGPPPVADWPAGPATFDLCKTVQAECAHCGARRDWLAPDWPHLHDDVRLCCAGCGTDRPHREVPGRDISASRHREPDGSVDMNKIRCFRRVAAQPA